MLLAKTKNGDNSSKSMHSNASSDDKLRLKCSQLQSQIRQHTQQMTEKNDEITKLKQKVAGISQLSKFRLEA